MEWQKVFSTAQTVECNGIIVGFEWISPSEISYINTLTANAMEWDSGYNGDSPTMMVVQCGYSGDIIANLIKY